jgi:hypothetical protein
MAASIDVTEIQGWKRIEAELPEDFEELAKQHKTLEVQYGEAKITSASDLLRLVLLHAGANLGLRQTVSLLAESGGPDVSHVTLHKKMRLAAPFLRALVTRMAGDTEANPERWAGYEVVAVDGSSFAGPRANSTDARVHLQLRLADLEILSATMEGRKTGESFKRFTWRPGQLAVADRCYSNPPGIAHVVDQGADVLVRVCRGSLPMSSKGEKLALTPWLRAMRGHAVHERHVSVQHEQSEIKGRLIAVRLPGAEAEKARARLRREYRNVSALEFEMAQYVVVFTTVPASRMPAAMCLALYRLRWQVELAFKRWKSICRFDRLPNYRDDTILSWLYAKLLLALILHRMTAAASPLFPPEEEEEGNDFDAALFDAVEDHDRSLARDRRRPTAA